MDSHRLRDLLLAELAGDRLSQELVLAALESLEKGDATRSPLRILHEALLAEAGAESLARQRLLKHVESVALTLARESAVSSGTCPDLDKLCLPNPRDFLRAEVAIQRLGDFMQLSKDRRHAKKAGLAAQVLTAIDEEWRNCKADLAILPIAWNKACIEDLVLAHCESEWADEESIEYLQSFLTGESTHPSITIQELADDFDATASRPERERLLDLLLEQESDLVLPFLIEIFKEPWARLRIAVAIAHRFPHVRFMDSDTVYAWLQKQPLTSTELMMMASSMRDKAHGDLDPVDFKRRWREKDASLRPLLTEQPPPLPARGQVCVPEHAKAEQQPQTPKSPSVWTTHLRPFFADNWYVFAGLLMLVVGCSIVAYYTWDRHWLWRYTLLPALLGVFTFALAGLGTWLERRTEKGLEEGQGSYRGTAASLRAAAIGLLPINFMTVAFLADDPQIGARGLLTAVAATVYLGLFGWGLRRWCRAVFAPIAALLGGALLLINGLVVLRPLAESLPASWISPSNIPVVIGTGFYLGFFALASVILIFGRRHLSKEIADEKVVPWFIGGTLLATFLQVMAWVHASLGSLPQVHTFAAMVVMAGGLLLFVERRVLALDDDSPGHRSESFLGFALILLGCLMAQGNEAMRVLCFLLAGAIWLYQARGRAHQAHQWIGLILLTLAVASGGIVEGFPKALRPALGFALAAAFSWSRAFAHKRNDPDLAAASHGMRDVVLVFSSLIAVMGQWADHTEPWIAATYLLANASLFLWFSHREGRLHLLHTAMLLLLLVLPYAGCVDLEGRSLHGNTMVFGIAVLSLGWLMQNWLMPTQLTLRARSTVLWSYGALAVAGMVLRVVIERGTPGDALWQQQAMDYSGPLLMAFVLVFATWFSRSLVPAIMGAVIVIILFPELKARFETTFSQLGWGTGIGSAINALALCVLCFFLRQWSFLKTLTPGDHLFGDFEFPLRRLDYTLFTWPLLASSIFLVSRTETWTLYVNLSGTMSVQTAWAIVISGAAWTALSAYGQALSHARLAFYLGCLSFAAGFFLLHAQVAGPFKWQVPTLWTFLLLQSLYIFYALVLVPRFTWAKETLSLPTIHVLRLATHIVLVLLVVELTLSSALGDSIWLAAFVALHLLREAFRRTSTFAGSLLFFLALVSVLASVSTEGQGWWREAHWSTHGTAVLLFLLSIQASHTLLEGMGKWWKRSLMLPFQFGSLCLAGLFCIPFIEGMVDAPVLTDHSQWLLLLGLVLLARSWRFTGPLLLSALLGYLWFVVSQLGFTPEVFAPWRLSALALSLTLIHACGIWLYRNSPILIVSSRSLGPDQTFTLHWLLGAASGIAFFATLCFVSIAAWRIDTSQVIAPYLGSMALLLASFLWSKRRVLYIAALVFTVGNIQLVRLLPGPWLMDHGLSELHLLCLGMALTLAFVAGTHRLTKDLAIRRGMDRSSMALAGMTLLLLSANYLIRHSLTEISSMRFLVSGALAYGASLVFRRVARSQDDSASKRAIFCESAYHFGVTIAIWCAALLIPPLREPNLALLALSLPAFWFTLRAEHSWRQGSRLLRPYRNSATTIACLLLALYAFRGAFQMILFPEALVQTLHYHMGSPIVILIGLALLRLHALGSGYWPGFYGGLAVMVGSFFALTSFPALRPFDAPLAGATVAILLAHFWTLVTTQRSPLRTAIQRLGAISTEDWHSLRTMWGLTLLFATQILTVIAVIDHGNHPKWVAPLILLAASLVLHHGLLRQIPIYLALGGAEVLLALHADFWVESWLGQDHVIWVLLAILMLGVGASWYNREKGRRLLPGRVFAVLAGFVILHVFHHGPWSVTALWSVGLLALMALALPRPGIAVSIGGAFSSGLVLLAPVWLAFFSQTRTPETWTLLGEVDVVSTWSTLCAFTAILAVAWFARACTDPLRDLILASGRERPCLLHHTLRLLSSQGSSIFIAASGTVIVLAALLQLAHYERAFDPPSFALFCALWTSLAWGSWLTARLRESALVFAVMEVCIAALFLLARRQLLLTTELWSPYHDVWASVIASIFLASAHRLFERHTRSYVIPLTISILVLPVLGISITLIDGLGTNVALFVVGMHSLLYSYMGKDNRESPYHILAVTGFTSFVLILFWGQLELRSVPAYVLPVGLGILFLLQLFRRRIGLPQRNAIRLVTVLTMLLSCAYYAILDIQHPIAFNLTLLLFSLATMLLGGFLRIRMHMTLGLAGILLSLGSIMYRILVGLERGSRMTLVGLLVLLTGATLVAGAIYYKTHKQRIGARLDALRQKLGDWE